MATCFGPSDHHLANLHDAGDFSFRICLFNNDVTNLMIVKCINLLFFASFAARKLGTPFFFIKIIAGYKNRLSAVGLKSLCNASSLLHTF